MTKREFVAHLRSAAEYARSKGALFCEAVLFAQAALESGWGNSGLTKQANNLFGIKAGKSWRGDVLVLPTKEWSKGRGWYTVNARWRRYPSWGDCVIDYALLISGLRWFRDALTHLDDPDQFLKCLLPELGQPGWATDPRYSDKVKNAGLLIQSLGGPMWARKEE